MTTRQKRRTLRHNEVPPFVLSLAAVGGAARIRTAPPAGNCINVRKSAAVQRPGFETHCARPGPFLPSPVNRRQEQANRRAASQGIRRESKRLAGRDS